MEGVERAQTRRTARTIGRIEATYMYGRADGRGVPRFLVMDDWERGESLREDKRMERGWTDVRYACFDDR